MCSDPLLNKLSGGHFALPPCAPLSSGLPSLPSHHDLLKKEDLAIICLDST